MTVGSRRGMLLKALLACGIASSVLYVGADIYVALQYPGYSYADQQVSELSAIGAPTRSLWIAMSSLYAPLVIAFGLGVWLSAGSKLLRVMGILVVAFGVIGLLWVLFAPMNLRGVGDDTMHLVFAGAQVLVMVTFIALGAAAVGGGFRLYSIATIVAMLAGGGLVSVLAAPAMAAGEATPWMGLVERVAVYSPMLWVAVLAVALLRRDAACG